MTIRSIARLGSCGKSTKTETARSNQARIRRFGNDFVRSIRIGTGRSRSLNFASSVSPILKPRESGNSTSFIRRSTIETCCWTLYYPANGNDGPAPLPLIIYTHGGGWAAGSKQGIANGSFQVVFRRLLDHGFAVASVNYRLCKADSGVTMRDCVIDSKDAVRYLAKNSDTLKLDSRSVSSPWAIPLEGRSRRCCCCHRPNRCQATPRWRPFPTPCWPAFRGMVHATLRRRTYSTTTTGLASAIGLVLAYWDRIPTQAPNWNAIGK